ncbi:MAG: hypothetical protein DWQ05_13545 [Calditrichaeota bacterium]|nr:MAG: hypothetical protein DWQ05_13545 [Calditrichota bacterium]
MPTQANIAKIKKVKKIHLREWMAIPQVQAVGIGVLQNGETGIIISVENLDKSIAEILPAKIDDVSVEIVESGRFKAL